MSYVLREHVNGDLKIDKLLLRDTRANVGRGLKVIRMLNFDRKASLGPVRVDIAATSACTYNCCFCISHSYLKNDEVQSLTMPDETLHQLFKDLRKLQVGEVLFSGTVNPFYPNHSLKR